MRALSRAAIAVIFMLPAALPAAGFAASETQPRLVLADTETIPANRFARSTHPLTLSPSDPWDSTFGLELAEAIDPFVAAIGLTGQGGALVLGVRRDSAAARARVLPGDLIVSTGGKPIGNATELVVQLQAATGTVAIEVVRVGQGPADLVAQLEQVAARGNRDALLALGDARLFNLDLGGEQATAEALYERAWDLGDARAAYRLGNMYAVGRGVAIDLAVATRWYRLAAERDLPAGQYALGLTWWNSRYWTGLSLIGDYAEAVRLFSFAAARGYAPAYRYLGLANQLGLGIPADFAVAAEWYEKAIAAGDVEAMFRWAGMVEAGQGVDPDPDRALGLLRAAARAGSLEANRRLGEKFWRGDGVMQHPLNAIVFLQAAAAQGDQDSMAMIAEILLSGYGVTRDTTGAVAWYFRAYQAGNGDAGYALALAYADGIGVPRDMAKVAGFMFEAIRRGSRAALAEMKGNAEGWDIEVRMELQALLAANGYYEGEIDGVFGPGTMRALDAAALGG